MSPQPEPVAYFCGRWVPFSEVRLSPNDLGFRQAVTAVERLRTYQQRVFELAAHLDRWERTTAALEIRGLPGRSRVEALVTELLRRNESRLADGGDVGVTLLATPGDPADAAGRGGREGRIGPGDGSTFVIHSNRLDEQRIERFRNQGQPLVVTDVTQPSPGCWPRDIKVRCRLHYYLADRQARRRTNDPDAGGILLDDDGSVTETSVANLAVVIDGTLISPPADRVLPGVTEAVTRRLADELAIPWRSKPLFPDMLRRAEGVLLMGTDAGLWFASSVDGVAQSIHPIGRSLLREFDRRTRSASG